ncbi:MAG: hypothetical protein AAB686_00400 [Patescibacteria group bacterium]
MFTKEEAVRAAKERADVAERRERNTFRKLKKVLDSKLQLQLQSRKSPGAPRASVCVPTGTFSPRVEELLREYYRGFGWQCGIEIHVPFGYRYESVVYVELR